MTLGSINDLHDLIDALDDASKVSASPWFRGMTSDRFKLVPRVFRNESLRESDLTFAFKRRAPALHQRCPTEQDYAGWLSLMQHHGLPTRLLDWSQSILIAAYFAVEETSTAASATDGAIWALCPGKLNESTSSHRMMVHSLASEAVSDYVRDAFDANRQQPRTANNVVAVLPSEIDPRMTLQHAAFTLHTSRTPMEDLPGASKWLGKFTVPTGSKERLREQLRRIGFSASRMFPDLTHLAQDCVAQRHGSRTTAIRRP
jgi:hypothetical protein